MNLIMYVSYFIFLLKIIVNVSFCWNSLVSLTNQEEKKEKLLLSSPIWINCMRVEKTVMSIYYWLLGW